MSKVLTPEQFTESCRAVVQAKQEKISQLRQQVAGIEARLTKFTNAPSIDGYEAAVKDQSELTARKTLLQRIEMSFNPNHEFDLLLNTAQGIQVLQGHLAAKTKFVDSLKDEARKLRSKALIAEEKGDAECYDLNQRADDLLDAVEAAAGIIKTASDHIKRMSVATDNIVNFRAICDRLDAIV